MRAFRIGYVFTLSFLLILAVVMLTFGFYPAPVGPKAPEYPTYPSMSYDSTNTTAYSKQQAEYDGLRKSYDEEKKQYDENQKTFLQTDIVPYARNVFMIWLLALVAFQVVGLLFVRRLGLPLVGAGYSFSGVWAVFLGPIGGFLWFASSIVSAFGQRANQQLVLDPLNQSIGIVSLLGVIVLSVLGFALLKEEKK